MKKINSTSLEQIIEMIREKSTYRDILKRFPELKSTSMITRIKKKYIDLEKPKKRKLSENTKRKIMVSAVKRKALEKSELILENHINVLETFKYSIKNLEEIQLLHKKDTEKIFFLLNELIKRLDKFFNSFEHDGDEELKIRNDLLFAASKVSDIHRNSLLRIKAIEALKSQIDSYLKFKIDVDELQQIHNLITAFIEGTRTLPDEQYFKYKTAVIADCEFARVFFDKWDEGLYETAESTEAVIIDEEE